MAGWLQFTGVLINVKGKDIAAGLIGRHQKPAGGIDAEIARRLTQRGLVLNRLQLAGLLIDAEYRNRVVIPSFDDDGDVNYFAARSYNGDSYKYKNA